MARLKTRFVLIGLVVVALLFSLVSSVSGSPPQQAIPQVPSGEYAPNRLIVRFKPGVTALEKAALHAQFGTQVQRQIPQLDTDVVTMSGPEALAKMALYNKQLLVQKAEPDYVRRVVFTPNDPYFGAMWNLSKIQAANAWDLSAGSDNVIVAIVDTGVDETHPDLAGKVVQGYNFAYGGTNTADDHGHGTHTAGTAAAWVNNGVGVAGVGLGARIMPIKVLDSSGVGYDSWVSLGLIYAVEHGAKVMSLSLGGASYSSYMQSTVDYVWSHGGLVVAAAGNDNGPGPFYPAGYNTVISVAATDSSDSKASFSNYGSWVTVAAPGVGILSTIPGGNYQAWSGTSMATPHVSGLAALLFGQNPSRTNAEVRQLIASNVDPVNSSVPIGSGRINAYKALYAGSSGSVPTATSTMTPVPATPTPTKTATRTATTVPPAWTSTPTNTPTSTSTAAPGQPTSTPTRTATRTSTPSLSSSSTPVPSSYFVSNVRTSPNPFNSALGSGNISFQLSDSCAQTVAAVVNLSTGGYLKVWVLGPQSAGVQKVQWDGKALDGTFVGEGVYVFWATCLDQTVPAWTPAFDLVNVGAVITNMLVAPQPYASQTGNATMSFALSFGGAAYTKVLIQQLQGAWIKDFPIRQSTSGAIAETWDGRDNSGNVVPDGTYLLGAVAVNPSNTSEMHVALVFFKVAGSGGPGATATPTWTPVPPASTRTSTPTVTRTPIPPAWTPTRTPTATRTPVPSQPTATPTPTSGTLPVPFAQQVIDLVNQQRAANGVGPLTMNLALTRAAQDYAQYMGAANFFDHFGPDGSTPWSRAEAAGYTGWTYMGENIAAGFTTPASVMAGWMNSPGHRANILEQGFRDIGVGYAYVPGSTYGYYWVQDFGSR